MPGPIVGIDLGTTNSVVAALNDGGDPQVLCDSRSLSVHPSIVSFHPNGGVLVGIDAKPRRVIDPQNTIFSAKRLIGRTYGSREVSTTRLRLPYTITEGDNEQPVVITRAGEFAIPEISALVLDHLKLVAKHQLGADSDRAVVTVPAAFNEAQRAATAAAGAIAGLQIERVLNEPSAAAMAYGHRKKLNETVAVYDFGGGTFDISILKVDGQSFEVLGTAGDSFLGGDDVDERLVEHMTSLFLREHKIDLHPDPMAIQRLRAVAEQIKFELGRRSRALVKVDEITYGAGGAAIDLQMVFARDEFNGLTRPVVDRTFPVCDEAFAMAGLKPNQIGSVLLVGGSTRMPLVRQRATEYFGQEPRADVNPEAAVALGAALQAATLQLALDGPGAVAVPSNHDDATQVEQQPAPEVEAPADRKIGEGWFDTETGDQPAQAAGDGSEPSTTAPAAAHPALHTPPPEMLAQPVEAKKDEPAGADEPAEPAAEAPRQKPQITLPTILEVTPQSLNMGTVAGYCETIIPRNVRVPTEEKRVFLTSRDMQESVKINVCQGESRRVSDNDELGFVVLEGLPPRKRGETKIEVSFHIDENAMLQVTAVDQDTGQEQSASLNLRGAQTEAEIEASKEKLEQLRS